MVFQGWLHPDQIGIPWPYPPLPRVVIRGGLSVVGPFHARYNFDAQRLLLKSLKDDEPQVYRLSRADFEAQADVVEYTYTGNHWDAKAKERDVELAFLHDRELSVLQEHAVDVPQDPGSLA